MAAEHIFPGYRTTEQLYAGTRTLVYRAVREFDQQPVVIKRIRNELPSFSELVQFRNQYAIAKNLNLPGIIRPYSLESYHNSYVLVMEDFGGISLRQFIKNHPLSLAQFFLISLQLVETLHQLHQLRIIHKDIKPSNILIHPDSLQVKLIDFAISTLLPKETQEAQNPSILEGTLAYLSPEQTGRMNRAIDYRSDFYSLGITFFELLTGQLPFQSSDPIELVHYHIAKQPPCLRDVHPELPLMLNQLVLKLMAKNAEDRYQSAFGLQYDLKKCYAQWRDTGEIEPFSLAERDQSDRFLIPEKLYGREQEVAELLAAFERVAGQPSSDGGQGRSELILVAGFSGIGKTAVVNEVHKPIARQRGYFIKGKYDQFQRNIPFSAFVQALRDLVGQVLSESDTQLEQWQQRILAAVGENGQVLIDLIPELEHLIGQQPAAPELSGDAAQNRFNRLFLQFIQVFATREHPLVIFIDDLQWADSASLKLLHLLMGDAYTHHLLLIGAYRDNEVTPAHPLMLMLDKIQGLGATVSTIALAPLDQPSISQLVADTLICSPTIATPLAELILGKTQGNPFFTTQFLKALYEEGWITFNQEGNYWQCDVAGVRSLALTDDVVEFMARQLQKLPKATQAILKLAACVGNQFDLKTLAIVAEQSPTEAAANLWKALQEGLILPQSEIYKFYQDASLVTGQSFLVSGQITPPMTNDAEPMSADAGQRTVSYKFLHDRVQQAAYSLIPSEQKASIHWQIGQVLLKHIAPIEQAHNLFDIVNHLNIGAKLGVQPAERERLARLNVYAAQKARVSTAYGSALSYATTGLTLLPHDGWQNQYELALTLHELAVENAFLARDFGQMNHWAEVALQQTKSPLDQVKIYEVQISSYISQHQPLAAIALGKQVLKQFGVNLPDHPTQSDIEVAFQQTIKQFAGRSLEELLTLPTMTAPEPLAAMRIAASTAPAVYFAAPTLYPLLILSQVNASIQHGNAPFSAFFYASYGLLLNGILEDMAAAEQAGQLALGVLEKLNAKVVESKTKLILGALVMHGTAHLQKCLQFLHESYQCGLETGDLEFAGHAAFNGCQYAYFCGQNLEVLEQEIYAYSQMVKNLNQVMAFNYCQLFRQLTLNLLGEIENPRLLIGEAYDETQALPKLVAANDQMGLHFFYLHKLILAYLFDDTSQSLVELADQAKQYLAGGVGFISVPLFYFYDSLSALAQDFDGEPGSNDRLQRVAENQAKLQKWAHHAPMNHLHKWHLVEAETHRVLGNKLEAVAHYDQAIALANEYDYCNEAAIANELAAKFYLAWNKQRIAQEYLMEAYYSYARWGAKAKLADLETRYPQMLAPILQPKRSSLSINETIISTSDTVASTTSSSGISDSFDLISVLKASQTLSKEIDLGKLLATLLKLIIENAGADKCVLILRQHDQQGDSRRGRLRIQGLAMVGAEPIVLQWIPVEESQDVPQKLIHRVKHYLESVVLSDAAADPEFASDPYWLRQQPKSVLCHPILHQGKLLGLVYLENRSTLGAFTRDRVHIIDILCAQATISIENAHLYQESQAYAQQLEVSLKALQESEKRFHNLAANVPGMIYQFCLAADGSASTPYVSSGCRDLYELDPEEVMAGKHSLYAMHHPDDHTRIEQAVMASAQALTPFTQEWRIITPSGNVKWLQSAARPERRPDGTITWDGVVLDVSDRKRAEAELQQRTIKLEQTLQELQRTQTQMVQAEKMSGLGQLVAGVAHEINNPVNFIYGNLNHANNYVEDLLRLVRLYQQHSPTSHPDIQQEIEAIDLDFLVEDLPKLLSSMRVGADRIQKIVLSLRTFSRMDEADMKAVNIHDGIDSTLMILQHRLKAKPEFPGIEIIKAYGELPLVECYAGQLNQVFMNLLSNAIDALEEAFVTHHLSLGKASSPLINDQEQPAIPTITIRTSLVNTQQVQIVISDNGAGMTDAVRQRLFDPFFTTKPVGKGTGMGLSISYQIITEKHNGSLTCHSTLGQGAEFLIQIPLRQ